MFNHIDSYVRHAYFYADALVKELISRGYVLRLAEYHVYHDGHTMVINMAVDLGTGAYSETFSITDIMLSHGSDLWCETIRVSADDVIRSLQQGGKGVSTPAQFQLCLPSGRAGAANSGR